MQRAWNALPEESKTITLGSKFESGTKKIIVSITTVPIYPDTWALGLSEALFNLRAALDYTVWELARWNLNRQCHPRKPYGLTQYPIATAEKQFNRRQVQDLHPSHVAIIKGLQPYSPSHLAQHQNETKAGIDPETVAKWHPAFLLQDLNNTDKHRLLQVSLVGATTTTLGPFTALDWEVENPHFFIQAVASM